MDVEGQARLLQAPSEAEWARMTEHERRRVCDNLPVAYSLPAELWPQAPTMDIWAGMSVTGRSVAIEALPCCFTIEDMVPVHRDVAVSAFSAVQYQGTLHGDTVRWLWTTLRRSLVPEVFIGSGTAVFYPGEPLLLPDLFVVMGASGDRMRWVVAAEGCGVDVVFEVIGHPDRRGELPARLERHARLGIREYIVADPIAGSIAGWRLDLTGLVEPMIAEGGLLRSSVLGIEISLHLDAG